MQNAVDARGKTIPILANMQLRISQAGTTCQAHNARKVAAILPPLETGIWLIEEWRNDYCGLGKIITIRESLASDYIDSADAYC